MHIPDGLLPLPAVLGGFVATGIATWYALRQINRSSNPRAGIPKAALLSAAFFVLSSIAIPIPPASVHLTLCGMLGVLLGVYAVPAILIGLFLQAILFGHGGITTLGVNGIMLGAPALMAMMLFRIGTAKCQSERCALIIGGFAGALGAALAVLIFAGIVIGFLPAALHGSTERTAITFFMMAHAPLIIAEGVVTGLLIVFLRRVHPQLLQGS